MRVLFPAPFSPTTPILEFSDTWAFTLSKISFSVPGYLNPTPRSFMMARSFEVIPSRNPGSGNFHVVFVSVRA
ncbi:hypothetical protein AR158_C791R [Paramecium bursaria Chlorella virus AR158]|nr:hypothetical protein AR158_C791R [Paramecium bursaria Chlorella virus AR158]ABU44336.1 hypothetical protein AR158_C791R [Paramecium bursaria Chlorella virus AR158]